MLRSQFGSEKAYKNISIPGRVNDRKPTHEGKHFDLLVGSIIRNLVDDRLDARAPRESDTAFTRQIVEKPLGAERAYAG